MAGEYTLPGIDHKKIVLIIGGHKNEQEKDIKKARIFIRRFATH